MADAVIHEIQNWGKIEALVGSVIIGIVGLIGAKFQLGETIDPSIFNALGVLVSLIIIIQLLHYLKFIIQKLAYFREIRTQADCQNENLILQIKKYELELKLRDG